MKRKIATLTMAILMVLSAGTTNAKTISIERLGGKDRFKTSVAIANKHFSLRGKKYDSLILAYGKNFPDSLGASALSSKFDAPILLVDKDSLDVDVEGYIKANLNKEGKCYILGGIGVIGEKVENRLMELGYEVERIGGVDRYDTNDKTNQKLEDFSTIIVVNGESFPDALSISSISAIKDYPIVLVGKDALKENSVKYIEKANRVYVIGGIGVVSDKVVNSIKDIKEGIEVIRIGGVDRYDTSKKIADYFKKEFTDKVVVANALNFPDALSGVCISKKEKAPILLTANENIDEYYKGYLVEKDINKAYILGGEGAVSKLTADTVANGGEKPEYYYQDKTINPIYDYWMRKPFKGMFVPKLGTPQPGNDLLVFENNMGGPAGWVMPVLQANLKATDNWEHDSQILLKYLEMSWFDKPDGIAYTPKGIDKGWETLYFSTGNSDYGVDYTMSFRRIASFSTDPTYAYQSQKVNWVHPQVLRYYFPTRWEELWDNMIGRSGSLYTGKIYVLDGREIIADGSTGALFFSKVGGKLDRNSDIIKRIWTRRD